MIRRATRADLPVLMGLGRRRVAAHDYGCDDDDLRDFLEATMAAGVILMTDRAMIGGHIVRIPWNRARCLASCAFWYSERPGDGLRLLRAFRAWARDEGAAEIVVAPTAADEKARAVLHRLGFEPMETRMKGDC